MLSQTLEVNPFRLLEEYLKEERSKIENATANVLILKLEGNALGVSDSSLEEMSKVCRDLYKNNESLIKENVPSNYYLEIDIQNRKLIASKDKYALMKYKEKDNKGFYISIRSYGIYR